MTGVVALGGDRTSQTWDGPQAANVLLRRYVPQRELLHACTLFITHVGFNGAREAIAAGVPMVALPLFGDHFGNAERLVALGLAIRLDAKVTRERLRETVAQVLADSAFRARAQHAQRQRLALPRLDRVPEDVQAVVG